MPLEFNASWRFEAPAGEVPNNLINEFSKLIAVIATQRPGQATLEHFKGYFAAAAGTTSSWSSNSGWAQSDLDSYMQQAALNVPLFIEAFFDGCEAFRREGVAVPEVRIVNRLIAESEVPYRIDPPELVSLVKALLRWPSSMLLRRSTSKRLRFCTTRSAHPSRCSLKARAGKLFRRSFGCWKLSPPRFAASIPTRAQSKESISTRSLRT